MKKIYIFSLCLSLALHSVISNARPNYGKYHDYRVTIQNPELEKMQDFHLQQALTKVHNNDLAHAWGDLSYLLCQVPNHHQALQQMLTIAPQLQKQDELHVFLRNAEKLFPDDPILHVLFSVFLHNIGEKTDATKHLQMAQDL